MQIFDWLAAAALGALVGAGEIVSRYRDAPRKALETAPAAVYLLVNLSASVAALAAVRLGGVDFGIAGKALVRWVQVVAAGLGSMALLRTSFFTARRGGQDFQVGPGGFLQILLDAADRSVDRSRARDRSELITELMGEISFARAHVALPAYCLALMQNLAHEEQESLARQIAELRRSPTDDRTKAKILGLTLMNFVGRDVLIEAIEALEPAIRRGSAALTRPASAG